MGSGIERVVADGMCTGCGLCAARFGAERVVMRMSPQGYLRPQVGAPLDAAERGEFARLCPGIAQQLAEPESGAAVDPLWGAIVSCHTGWSADDEIRQRGSSGGALSGLLTHLLDSGQADFVAHVVADPDNPFGNVLQLSRSRAEVLAGAGSRYSPSAPLGGLERLFATPGRFAFVGKPCDVAGLRAYLREVPERAERVVALLSFMCAGVPSELGSKELARRLGTEPERVVRFQYRGNGWPGMATAWTDDGARLEMDYATSWGSILNRHLQFRCKVCPDGIGEFADIVGADAWYGAAGYPDFQERAGRSLILARSQVGARLLAGAVGAGAVVLESCDVAEIALMQPYQEARKRQMLSRLAAFWLRRRWLPRYRGFRLWRVAGGLSLKTHARNFLGTWKRIPARSKS
jgi:coenzyme F420 hydrogenase subunit beta